MRWWVVVVVLLVGCKTKRGLKEATEQDALWKLAPLTATRGIVISGDGLTAIESGYRAVARALETVPELAPFAALVQQGLPSALTGPDGGLAKAGLSARGGLAMFHSKSGATLMILPVVNRAAFLEVVHGAPGAAGDTVGELTCKMVGDRYACARPVELLGRMGKGSLRDQIERVGSRGDIEIALEEDDTRGGMVATFQRGGVMARGAVRDKRLARFVVNAAQDVDPTRLAGFGVFNLAGMLAGERMPPEPLAAGLTFADLMASMAGPVRLSLPPGMTQGEVRVALKDARVARTLVEKCEEIPHLALLSSRLRDKVCHLTAPGYPLDFAVSVEGNTLRAQVENVPATPNVALRPTALSKELASGSWAFSMYGRGALVGLPPNVPVSSDASFGMRVLGTINESGVGIRADGDVVRFVLGVRTIWSNPDDVVAKWLAIPLEQLLDGRGRETARSIAARAHGAPLVDDVAAGNAIVFSISALSVVAGFASPALLGQLSELTSDTSPAEEIFTSMSTFTDAMCACKDPACAQRVSDDMRAWSVSQARRGKPPELSESDKLRATAIGERMSACMQAAFGMNASAAPMNANDLVSKHVEFRDRLCSCADLVCGEAVSREMTAWSEVYMKKLPAGVSLSAADESAIAELESDMRSCMISLRAKK